MNMIFSADAAWGIGKDNRLLFHAKEDMEFFRRMTLGKTVIMGRKTLDSLPGGRPLPERQNVVLTRSGNFSREGIVVCLSLPELFEFLSQSPAADVMVIGGEQIYRQLLPYCSLAYVTRWQSIANADSFVPDFDTLPGWELIEKSEPKQETGVSYCFCTYEQQNPVSFNG